MHVCERLHDDVRDHHAPTVRGGRHERDGDERRVYGGVFPRRRLALRPLRAQAHHALAADRGGVAGRPALHGLGRQPLSQQPVARDRADRGGQQHRRCRCILRDPRAFPTRNPRHRDGGDLRGRREPVRRVDPICARVAVGRDGRRAVACLVRGRDEPDQHDRDCVHAGGVVNAEHISILG